MNGFFHDDTTTLYVTDFTENKLMMNYERKDDSSWPGPWGQRVLQVTCWNQNRPVAAAFTPKTPIYLRNVRIKVGKAGLLEATLYGDQKYTDKVDLVAIKEQDEDGRMQVLKQLQKWAFPLRTELI